MIAKLLYHSREKRIQIHQEQEDAFKLLKNKLVSVSVLNHYDPKKSGELRTDASKSGLGSILLHVGDDNQLHPVAYASRSLTKAEKNFTTTELEALAVVWSLLHLRHMIYGKPIQIVVDHHSLCYLRNAKDLAGKLIR